ELQVAVALDARVRRQPPPVRLDVGLDDPGLELVAEVPDVVGDAELLGHPAGVVDVGHRAAAGVGLAAPEPHGHADHLVAGRQQAGGGHRRVDAARHGDEHLHAATSRSRAAAAGTDASARSTSAALLDHPSDRRSAPRASSAGTPIAASTWDACWAPLAQAEAAEAHTPSS